MFDAPSYSLPSWGSRLGQTCLVSWCDVLLLAEPSALRVCEALSTSSADKSAGWFAEGRSGLVLTH